MKEGPAVERMAGGIRSVLSELKKSMVESCRVISDKNFKAEYEMVQGDRAILGEGIKTSLKDVFKRRLLKDAF